MDNKSGVGWPQIGTLTPGSTTKRPAPLAENRGEWGSLALESRKRNKIDEWSQTPQASQGLITPTPVRSKWATFLVATVRPCTRAVAAMRASRSERGFGT
jgi:hypothetical protein